MSSRETALQAAIAQTGFAFEGEIKIGGNYVPVLVEDGTAYVSGQVPRVGDSVVVTGRVGAAVTLAQAQLAARVCTIRALLLLRQRLGNLDAIHQLLRVGVYVQCSETFTQQSEVADAASNLLVDVLGEAGHHTRTSVGVYQLPKGASVELELTAAVAQR